VASGTLTVPSMSIIRYDLASNSSVKLIRQTADTVGMLIFVTGSSNNNALWWGYDYATNIKGVTLISGSDSNVTVAGNGSGNAGLTVSSSAASTVYITVIVIHGVEAFVAS